MTFFTLNSNFPLFMATMFLIFCIIIRVIMYSFISTWCFFIVFTVYIGGVLITMVYISRLSGIVKYFLNVRPLLLLVFIIQIPLGGVLNIINNNSNFFYDIRNFLIFFSLVLIRGIFLIVKMSERFLGSLIKYN